MSEIIEETEIDESLYEMSDEELQAAVREAKQQEVEPDVEQVTPEVVEDEEVELDDNTDIDEEVELDDGEEDAEDEDTEQPDEDSDNEADEEVEEEVTDEPSDGEHDDAEDDKATDETEKEAEPATYKIRANGQDFEFTIDELKQLAPQAMDYTKKMQTIKPWRQTISALEENDISMEDVNLMIDVLKGDKDAIASIVNRAGIDTLELDTENVKYEPKMYGKTETELDIREVEQRIAQDKEYSITTHVFNNQWDEQSRSVMYKNPAMIEGLHNDIKTGVFDKVSPQAMKLKALDGGRKSDLDYYIEAGQQLAMRERQVAQEQAKPVEVKPDPEVEKAKKVVEEQKTIKKAAKKRKAAAPTKKAAGNRKVIDYLDDSDEAFEEWYKKLEASM